MKRGKVVAFALASVAFAASADTALAETITVTPSPIGAAEGTSLSNGQIATFTDSGGLSIAGDYSGSIAWGDGITSTATIAISAGAAEVIGSHTYAEEGTYDVTVAVHDLDSVSSGAGSVTATI